jgi:hypothetical protein
MPGILWCIAHNHTPPTPVLELVLEPSAYHPFLSGCNLSSIHFCQGIWLKGLQKTRLGIIPSVPTCRTGSYPESCMRVKNLQIWVSIDCSSRVYLQLQVQWRESNEDLNCSCHCPGNGQAGHPLQFARPPQCQHRWLCVLPPWRRSSTSPVVSVSKFSQTCLSTSKRPCRPCWLLHLDAFSNDSPLSSVSPRYLTPLDIGLYYLRGFVP